MAFACCDMRLKLVTSVALAFSACPTYAQDFAPFPKLPPSNQSVDDRVRWLESHIDFRPAYVVSWGPDILIWLDPEHVDRTNAPKVRAWFRAEVLTKDKADQLGYRSLRYLDEFDCDQKTIKHLAQDRYFGNNESGGDAGSEDHPDARGEFVRPSTNGEAAIAAACNVNFGLQPPPSLTQ